MTKDVSVEKAKLAGLTKPSVPVTITALSMTRLGKIQKSISPSYPSITM